MTGYARIVHQDEASLRKSFIETCEGHFLTQLFPGIVEQFSPSFATSPPSPFDTNLPPVSVDDLERLKNALPTLWARLQLPGNLKAIKYSSISLPKTQVNSFDLRRCCEILLF